MEGRNHSALEAPPGSHTYIVISPALKERDEALRLLQQLSDGGAGGGPSQRAVKPAPGEAPPEFRVQRVMQALPYFTATMSRAALLWACGQPGLGPRILSVELDQAVRRLEP